MKYCRYCGHELPEDSSFCIYCMRELSEREEMQLPRFVGKKAKRWIVVASTMLAVALVGVALTGILRSIETDRQKEISAARQEAGLRPATLSDLDSEATLAGRELIKDMDSLAANSGLVNWINTSSAEFYGAYAPNYIGKFGLFFEGNSELLFTQQNDDFIFTITDVSPDSYLYAILAEDFILRTFSFYDTVEEGANSFSSFANDAHVNNSFIPCEYEYKDHIYDVLHPEGTVDGTDSVTELLNEGTLVSSEYIEGTYYGYHCYFERRTCTESDGTIHYDYTLIGTQEP